MKNLIRKILKESEEDFGWVEGLDVGVAEKEIFKPFKDMEYEFSADAKQIYGTLIEFGVRQPSELKEFGELLYDEFQTVFDSGYDNGRDSCDCDGCCDNYVWYEDHTDAVNTARDEGYDNGYSSGKEDAESNYESEIDELRGQIQELQSTIEELRSRGEE